MKRLFTFLLGIVALALPKSVLAADPDLSGYTLIKAMDFTSATYSEETYFTLGDKVGTAWMNGNKKQSDVFNVTSPAELDGYLALQAAYDGGTGKGWYIRPDKGGMYCINADRCGAVTNLKEGYIVVFTCNDDADNVMTLVNGEGNPDGPFTYVKSEDTKSFYCTMTADGNVGFDGKKNIGYISSISIYAPGTVVVQPTGKITAVNGTKRTVTFTGANLAYNTDGSDTYTETNQNTLELEVTETTTYYVVSTNGDQKSDVLTFTVEAGTEVSLATPTVTITAMGAGFTKTYSVTCDNKDVLLNPAAKLTYTFTPTAGGTAATDVEFDGTINATEAGTYVITASAEGYTSTTATIDNTKEYELSKAIDFAALTSEDLSANWKLKASGVKLPGNDNQWKAYYPGVTADEYYYDFSAETASETDIIDGLTVEFNKDGKTPKIYTGFGFMYPIYVLNADGSDGSTAITSGNIGVANGTADQYAVYTYINNYSKNGTKTTVLPGDQQYALYRFSDMLTKVEIYSPKAAKPVEYAVGKLDFATIDTLSGSSIVKNTLMLEADEFTATFTGNVSYREFNGKKYIGIEAAGCNLVIKGKDGKRINRVVFTSSSNFSIKAKQGTLNGKIWTGDEEEVTFTNGAFDTEITGITVGDYVEPATDVENIGALKGIATGTNVNLKLNGAVVTFVKDNMAFIEDETGAIKLNNIGLSLTAGTALKGNLYATYTGGSIPSLGSNAQTTTSKFTSEETTVTPTLATVQGLNGMMYTNRLIKLVGSMSVSGNWLMFGGTTIWIDDYFNVLPDEYEYPSEIGSLLAIGGSDGVTQEIYPVSAEDIIEPANVQPEKAANIAALRDMPGNIAVELTLTNAKVTVDETVAASGEDEGGEGGEPDPLADEGERTIIVEDATGAVAISADVADALSTVFTGSGIALNGSLTATLANTDGDISLSANDKTANSTVTSAAAEVMPTEMSVAESMAEENSLKLVKYVGATISGDATAGYTVTQPEAQIPAQVAMVDKFKKLAEVPTEAVDLTGVIYYNVYVGNFEFWPLSYTEPEPEQVYKTFTKSEVFLPTAENVTAAVAEGWVEHGGNYTDNKKGTIDPATGETVEPQNFPGVGLKKGNAGKSFVTYVTGIDKLTAYGVTGNSSDPRTLVVTATPTDGSEAVIGQATSEPNTAVVTLTLDPTKQYAVDYTGINATGSGADVALHGVKFTVTASEPQEYRKWDFTAWSQETKDNLEAEFLANGYTEAPAPTGTETGWRRYEKDGAEWTGTDGLKDAGTIYWYGSYISEPTELKANGVTIAETKGLKFNNITKLNNTVAIAIDYPETSIGTYAGGSYIWLNGGDLQITIPAVAPGQKVLMEVESHKNTDARGVKLSVNGTEIGEGIPTTKQSYEWTIPTDLGTEPVDVLVSSTAGCHIYLIEVGDADLISVGINEVNADVKRADNNVYTINGVMVRKAGESLDGLAKGLYIVGGKKVVVK